LFKALTLQAGPGTLTTTPYSSLAACIKVLPVLTLRYSDEYSSSKLLVSSSPTVEYLVESANCKLFKIHKMISTVSTLLPPIKPQTHKPRSEGHNYQIPKYSA